tara:strand:- start:1697 stop:2557 length:861 start_codon:yes stop_codon:yes gene_type:complete
MKKLLGIVVLGLLMSGCASEQEKIAYDNRIKSVFDRATAKYETLPDHIDIERMNFSFWTGADFNHAASVCRNKNKFYFYFRHTTALERDRTGRNQNGAIIYCSAEYLGSDPIFGPAHLTVNNFMLKNPLASTNYDPATAKKLKKSQKKSSQNKEDLLISLKKTCEEFGYKDGSEKMADCMKELYLEETQEENVVINNNSMNQKSKRNIDPSVWDDLGKISEDLLGGKSVSESIGGASSSSGTRKITCFKTGEETGGLNKICRYDCVGNLVTTTIGAAQMCPIQIQR